MTPRTGEIYVGVLVHEDGEAFALDATGASVAEFTSKALFAALVAAGYPLSAGADGTMFVDAERSPAGVWAHQAGGGWTPVMDAGAVRVLVDALTERYLI